MKNILKAIITTLLLSLTVSSCGKFLEENPRSQFSEGNFYVDVESLRASAVGAFAQTRSLYDVGTDTPLFIGILGTDETMYPEGTNIRGFIDRYSFTSTDGCIKEFWKKYYKIITVCNTVLYKSQYITGKEAEIKLYRANMYFLRAWAYFNLVQIYGDVPIMKDHVTEFDYSIGRSPLRDVYSLIVSDLSFACEDEVLPMKVEGAWANHWAAKTLLAKVYLTMASAKGAAKVDGYAEITETQSELYLSAQTLLDDVITNSGKKLEPVYGDVFMIANKNINSETLWEIQFSKLSPYGSQWSKEYGAYASGYDSSNLTGGWRSNGVAGSCALKYVPSLWNYYKAGDVRREWNLADYIVRFNKNTNKPTSTSAIPTLNGAPQLGDIMNQKTIQFSGAIKFRWGKDYLDDISDFVYSNCPNNVIVLRYADVLLMRAEVELALNNGVANQTGLDAINKIVQRARGVDASGNPRPESSTPMLLDYTTYTLDDILMERARELCFERWRWYDLARTGKFEHFLVERNLSQYAKTSFDPEKHYLFPVPLDEIQLSTSDGCMYQNPRY